MVCRGGADGVLWARWLWGLGRASVKREGRVRRQGSTKALVHAKRKVEAEARTTCERPTLPSPSRAAA